MTDLIDIKNIKKEEVLTKLYNASKIQGMGFFQAVSGEMTIQEAKSLLDATDDKYFDYLHGKIMKIDLNSDILNTALYDRDNGPGAAKRALGL